MFVYHVGIPAAAVKTEVDGKRYAHVGYTVTKAGIRACEARRVRFTEPESYVHAGVAHVYIGRMGRAVAQLENLPFPVTVSEI